MLLLIALNWCDIKMMLICLYIYEPFQRECGDSFDVSSRRKMFQSLQLPPLSVTAMANQIGGFSIVTYP